MDLNFKKFVFTYRVDPDKRIYSHQFSSLFRNFVLENNIALPNDFEFEKQEFYRSNGSTGNYQSIIFYGIKIFPLDDLGNQIESFIKNLEE